MNGEPKMWMLLSGRGRWSSASFGRDDAPFEGFAAIRNYICVGVCLD
jgi:hypothetical protein